MGTEANGLGSGETLRPIEVVWSPYGDPTLERICEDLNQGYPDAVSFFRGNDEDAFLFPWLELRYILPVGTHVRVFVFDGVIEFNVVGYLVSSFHPETLGVLVQLDQSFGPRSLGALWSLVDEEFNALDLGSDDDKARNKRVLLRTVDSSVFPCR